MSDLEKMNTGVKYRVLRREIAIGWVIMRSSWMWWTSLLRGSETQAMLSDLAHKSIEV